MIVGITGTIASGKTKLAKILENFNYEYFSFVPTIEDKIKLYYPSVQDSFIESDLSFLKKGKDYVLDDLHNLNDITNLKKRNDFFLIYVDDDVRYRFCRWGNRVKNFPQVSSEIKTWQYYWGFFKLDFDKKMKSYSEYADYRIEKVNTENVLKLKEFENLKINNPYFDLVVNKILNKK